MTKELKIDVQKFGIDTPNAPFTEVRISIRTTKLSVRQASDLQHSVLAAFGRPGIDYLVESSETKVQQRRDKGNKAQVVLEVLMLLPVIQRTPHGPQPGVGAGSTSDESAHPMKGAQNGQETCPSDGVA